MKGKEIMKKYRKFKKATAVLMIIALFSCCSLQTLAYDHAAAQRYSDQYVLSPNPAYRYWPGGDCTNFVSQCMKAGGMAESDDWYYNHFFSQSLTWVNANELKEHLKLRVGATLLSRWSKYGYTLGNGIQFFAYINNSDVIQGWGNEIIFYDWTGDGLMDHASIVVGTNNPIDDSYPEGGTVVGDLINQHTTNRRWKYWHLDYFNDDKATTEICAYRLPNNV